jgi:hypothetical protein
MIYHYQTEVQSICSIQSTHFRYQDIEQGNRTQDLDCYMNTGDPYILHQCT